MDSLPCVWCGRLPKRAWLGRDGLEYCQKACEQAYQKKISRLPPPSPQDSSSAYQWLLISSLSPSDQVLARAMRGNQSSVLEHRLVMARSIGRPLGRFEVVHHRDGVKTHNYLANLELMWRDDHDKFHGEICRQYALLRKEYEKLWLWVLGAIVRGSVMDVPLPEYHLEAA